MDTQHIDIYAQNPLPAQQQPKNSDPEGPDLFLPRKGVVYLKQTQAANRRNF